LSVRKIVDVSWSQKSNRGSLNMRMTFCHPRSERLLKLRVLATERCCPPHRTVRGEGASARHPWQEARQIGSVSRKQSTVLFVFHGCCFTDRILVLMFVGSAFYFCSLLIFMI
jgi:hypothetical protein